MNKELIIRSGSEFVDFALLKDGKLIELHKEEEKSNFKLKIFYAK
jgi:ribonuclease G